MKLQYRIALFVFLILLETYFDPYIRQCNSLYGKFLMLVHHFSVIFTVLFSVLFGYHLIHFIFVLIITILFVKNDGCVLTFYNNNVCSIDIKKEFPSWITYIYETANVNNKLVLCSIHSIIMLYDLYMIFFIKKNLTLLT